MKKISITKVLVCVMVALMLFVFSGCDMLLGFFQEEPDSSVYIYQSELLLEVGQTVQLKAASTDDDEVAWVSTDNDVATVEDGLITAVGVGECTVIATSNKAQATCLVKVSEKQQPTPPIGDGDDTPDESDVLVLFPEEMTMAVGEQVQLKATSKANLQISWRTSAPKVVSVQQGLITALTVGEATITASTSLASAQIKITVTASDNTDDSEKAGYRLVWRDEFNGTSLDTSKWGYQLGVRDQYGSSTGPVFWGNEELQYYTADAVSVADGMLKITATKQAMPDGRSYSSGRILTRDKASWTYGYFEARMKTPTGNGMWPAFWMLPQPSTTASSDNIYGGWPANGEIDIMEAKGRLGNVVDTTLHFGKAWDAHDYVSRATTLSTSTEEWHTYAVEWTNTNIIWYIDGEQVLLVSKARWWTQDASNQGQSAPFDQPFYILFNLAVGGMYDNYEQPDGAFTSAAMYVDYVRVYEKLF